MSWRTDKSFKEICKEDPKISNTFHVNNYEVTEDGQIYGFLLGVKDINVQEVGGGRYSGNWAVLNCSIVFTPVN